MQIEAKLKQIKAGRPNKNSKNTKKSKPDISSI